MNPGKNIFITIICLISLPLLLSAQSSQKGNALKTVMAPSDNSPQYKINTNTTNEVKIFFSTLFVGYKSFISSQDGSRCSFTPSCSVYMKEVINKQGFVLGFMNGMDRLMRCNGLSHNHYPFDPNKDLLKDPPSNDPFIHSSNTAE